MNEDDELDSTCGVSDKEMTYRFQQGVIIENKIKRLKGLPVAGYDTDKKQAYLEYPDGHREYVPVN